MYCGKCGCDLDGYNVNIYECYCPNCGCMIDHDTSIPVSDERETIMSDSQFYQSQYNGANYSDNYNYNNMQLQTNHFTKQKQHKSKVPKILIIALITVILCIAASVTTVLVIKNKIEKEKNDINDVLSYINYVIDKIADDENIDENVQDAVDEVTSYAPEKYQTDIVKSRIYYVSGSTPAHAGLNLKSQPSSSYGEKLTTLPEGTQVIIEKTYDPNDNGYVYVSYYDSGSESNRFGWVMVQHLVTERPDTH